MKIKEKLKSVYTDESGRRITKETDNWSGILFGWPISIPVAKLLSRFPRIQPNHVTLACIPAGVLSGYMFFLGELKLGALFYWVFFVLDGVDGNLARLTNRTSEFGKKLDFYTHIINSTAMFLGLWWSQYYLAGEGFIGAIIILSHYIVMGFGYLFVKKWTYKTIIPRVHSYYSSLEEAFGTFFIAPMLNMVRILLPMLIIIEFISFLILFLRQDKKPTFEEMKDRIRKKFGM